MTDRSRATIESALRNGKEHIVSFTGRSQYSSNGGGASACGLAALNCARLVLQRDHQGLHGLELFAEIAKQDMFEEILGICLNWGETVHLDVDDIFRTPVFSTSLTLAWTDYDQPGLKQLHGLLSRLEQATEDSVALVITRPPEIVCALRVKVDGTAVFATFDSHPRPKHPDGAALIIHPTLEAAVLYLSHLLQFDPVLLADPTLQWQAQLLAHYSAHMFVAKGIHVSSPEVMDALIDASLNMLLLQAKVSELENQCQTLESDNRQLAEENMKLEARVEDLEEDVKRHVRRATFSQPVPIPTHTNGASTQLSSKGGAEAFSDTHEHPNDQPVASSSKTPIFSDPSLEDDESFAARIQLEWQEQVEPGITLVRQRQKEYEEEDKRLRAQYESLKQEQPATFQCGICLEEEAEYTVAKIEGCGHSYCRGCILSYLRSKLAEHRFPIPCPICATDRSEQEPGTIDVFLAQNIGLTEGEFTTFSELELAAFSVPLQCHRCNNSVHVDREEYDAQSIIVCPLPGCNYAWCKTCSRAIEIGGPPHSCDGTSELRHLMDEQGWKHCPGCRTPTSKIEGCNHMTCISPGCNTHFCYLCGETIVQSMRREEIRRALSNHYTRCRMIDDVI